MAGKKWIIDQLKSPDIMKNFSFYGENETGLMFAWRIPFKHVDEKGRKQNGFAMTITLPFESVVSKESWNNKKAEVRASMKDRLSRDLGWEF